MRMGGGLSNMFDTQSTLKPRAVGSDHTSPSGEQPKHLGTSERVSLQDQKLFVLQGDFSFITTEFQIFSK